MPQLSKPHTCTGCPLESKGLGYAPAVGPTGSRLLLVGEALGDDEVRQGEPFVGRAGGILGRILTRSGINRSDVRIDNTVRCQPPNNWLEGAPWERGAVNHCSQYLNQTLQEDHQVIIALGGTATRRLLNLGKDNYKHQDWHGSPIRVGKHWIISTFHPAFVFKRGSGIIGGMLYDFQVAKEVIQEGWTPELASLVVDPDIAWFNAWVEEYLSHEEAWLSCDIETPEKLTGKSEEELEQEGQILRINFSFNRDQGITVPWSGQYLAGIRRLLSSSGVKAWWNARYDIPILRAQGYAPAGTNLDFMWGWHILQSDLPRGLGYVSPFYSRYGPWKHLSSGDPGRYAAIDAVQTTRVASGIARDLQKQGQWDTFYRHVYELDQRVLHPAEDIGLLTNKEKLTAFKEKLLKVEQEKQAQLKEIVPKEALEWHPKGGWTRPHETDFIVTYKRGEEKFPVGYRQDEQFTQIEQLLVQVCVSCNAQSIARTHRCRDKSLTPVIDLQERPTPRHYVHEPFNPGSWQQVLKYMSLKGHEGGKGKKKKSSSPSTDKKTLQALAKKTKDPFYQCLLDYRAVSKVRTTYVEGAERRVDSENRLHCNFLHAPSTMRLSCVNPNLQNVVADRSGPEALAAGFRACLVAAPGHVLVEADFSGIEAVQTGWYAGDPDYIRLAKLGVHAFLASHLIGAPADLKWSDQDLGKYFKDIKKRFNQKYDEAKHVVHGTNYGLSPFGMVQLYPEVFTRASAIAAQGLYFEICPKLKSWQDSTRERAAKNGYLGGADHPYRYKHWYWLVKTYDSKKREWGPGPDSKRCLAFYPSSTAAGKIKDSALGLMDPAGHNYIGDLYAGRTPIRALVHDSILVEVPIKKLEEVVWKMNNEMTLPIPQQPCPPEWKIGSHLTVGVAIKWGYDWLKMQDYDLKEVGVASDTAVREEEEEVA